MISAKSRDAWEDEAVRAITSDIRIFGAAFLVGANHKVTYHITRR
jgi:hypothetical protein